LPAIRYPYAIIVYFEFHQSCFCLPNAALQVLAALMGLAIDGNYCALLQDQQSGSG